MSFDPFWFCSWKVLLAFWICCFQKHQGRFLLLLGIWRIKDKTLNSHFDFHFSKKIRAYVSSLPFPPLCPSLPPRMWNWLGIAHPYGSISNSSCTGYQILCLLVPGSKSSADLWTSVQKKKKKPGVWRKDAPLWIKSLHQLLSPQKRPGPLNALFKF